MTVRIVRRPKAAQDAEEIADYIAGDSLSAAIRFLENLESTLADLAGTPNSGTRFESTDPRLTGLMFRRVRGFPRHVVFYKAIPGAIEVVRILHGSRDLPPELRDNN